MLRISEKSLTFDDVLLLPAHSALVPKDVPLVTRLTNEIQLNIPLVSAAMDTVTESRLAIAMAQEGGIGIIHKNMTIEQQANEVRLVKKYESGVIKDPITVSPDTSIREVLQLTRQHTISGVPVVEGEQLVGIVTNRDTRFETRYDAPVSSIMTGKDKLVTVKEGAGREEVLKLLHEYRIEKVLVVDDHVPTRALIRTILEAERTDRFEVVEVGTGTDCLKAADKQGEFDLILLDVNLPDGSGFELTRRWRDEGLVVPILLLTARDDVIPDRFFEPVTSGPLADKPPFLKEDFEQAKRSYYRLMGWDEHGIPALDKLAELEVPGASGG